MDNAKKFGWVICPPPSPQQEMEFPVCLNPEHSTIMQPIVKLEHELNYQKTNVKSITYTQTKKLRFYN